MLAAWCGLHVFLNSFNCVFLSLPLDWSIGVRTEGHGGHGPGADKSGWGSGVAPTELQEQGGGSQYQRYHLTSMVLDWLCKQLLCLSGGVYCY